ncbi:hypothetical protein ACWEF9_18155 [Streptomyces sp. NPDC004980]
MQFIHVGAQLEVTAFGCLPAPQFQCVRQACPGDLLTAGGSDEVAFVLGQLLAQRSDDQDAREQVGFGELVGSVEFNEPCDLVIFAGDFCQSAGRGKGLIATRRHTCQ